MDVTRRCINCSMRLAHQRWRMVEDATEPMVNILRVWVSPTPVSSNSRICLECFGMLQQVPDGVPAQSPVSGHRNVCFACGISILRARTHLVHPDSPERNVIISWTFPHLVSHLNRVCTACWLAARRNVQKQTRQDANRPIEAFNEETDNREPPHIPVTPPLPHISVPQRQETARIISQTYSRVAATSRHCIFSGCENVERLLVPTGVKEMLLCRYRLYIPSSARVCRYHLENDCWEQLQSNIRDFTASQMDHMLNMMERINLRTLDFNNINMMPPNLCQYWLGVTAAQFHELLAEMPSLHNEVPSASVALSIYLAKLRTGDSNERLSSLFEMPRSTLERNMNKARNCMSQQMVPLHLGLNHMTVEEVAARNKTIPEGLFGNPNPSSEMRPAIVICDATYVYVQSSSNYLFQKESFSLHKHLNLVKPFMIVCCDGHILDCLGPYRATVNDATIMSNEFRNSNGEMRRYFREGDIFILDRGFRDVIPELIEYGYQAHMPESLSEGEHQLTTQQANKSRCVTMCRWVVEVVNGRLKRDFKLFRQEFFNKAAKHLMIDFWNGCALTNKLHPLIEDIPEAAEYLAIAVRRLHIDNVLANTVRIENYNRRRATFVSIDAHHPHLDQFPRLSITDLKRFALGTYQLKQASSYYGEHVRTNGTYTIEINNEIEEDIPLILGTNHFLLRGRIKSRHIGGRTYYAYLLISKDENVANSVEAISGYCCSCLVGNRTVGCCAHVMCVVWYLGWGRYNDVTAPAQFLDDIFNEFSFENE
ncbi:uncharacterized protein LOC123667471 [Melitaea cinxia]|uniref:uncharacterized protein LOC123667471 n=1 Tax=Melitaea cinxia TaxID=113334 RepID=UPI001E270F07|nr:uncharacterized protein LOC123667471 [Melitaea cinxia]